MPATRDATTGRPAPIASTIDSGRPSQNDGMAKMSIGRQDVAEIAARAEEVHATVDAERRGPRSQLTAQLAVADDDQVQRRQLRPRHRVEEKAVRFLFGQAGDDAGRRHVVRHADRSRETRRASSVVSSCAQSTAL